METRPSTPSLTGWPGEASPFHAGEQALQARIGMRERMELNGRRSIRDAMPEQHRELFGKLPYLLVGSLDTQRRPWASILVGRPGFLDADDPQQLVVAAQPAFGDPLRDNLALGAPLGLLGIELATRRRNRMNGRVAAMDAKGFTVQVEQSFGNCPQYIQARVPAFTAEPASVAAPRPVRREGDLLSAGAADLVRRGDTFFIASAAPDAGGADPVAGVDVSHRGGKPGFVRVTERDGATVLTAPDFSGNRMFNTFGNLALDPHAGLLFVDFATGDVLSLTGTAEVIWDGAELAHFARAERLLLFRVSESVWIEKAVPLRWSRPEPAPQLAATGSWNDATRTPGATPA